MNWLLLAADAINVAPDAATDPLWKTGALALGGMVLMKFFSWISSWMDGKGKDWINDRFQTLQAKLNSNTLLAQIQADDAMVKILEAAIPEIVLEISETSQGDLKDGRFDVVDWMGIGKRLWERVKPQVEGGAHDYLKASSFQDGVVLATWVAQRFFKRQAAAQKGLVP